MTLLSGMKNCHSLHFPLSHMGLLIAGDFQVPFVHVLSLFSSQVPGQTLGGANEGGPVIEDPCKGLDGDH